MKEIQEFSDADARNEQELVRQVLDGSHQAFTQLVNLYQKKVYQLAYGFFKDRDDAMEIVQETFMRLYEKMHKFEKAETSYAFRSWVYRIAYNLCIDYYRKFKKKKADDRELLDFLESESESHSPEDHIERAQFRIALEKSVSELSNRQQKVFRLRHYSQLKHQEISEVMDISVGTVKTLYHRAVKGLEKRLGGYGFEVAA